VGELEFAFTCFLIGQILEAFEHGKQLVRLVCSCDDAVSKREKCMMMMMEAQLIEIPRDFLEDIVASNNFVYHNLHTLFRALHFSETGWQTQV
jgi:A1 cistron-splicing factor AAR2